MAGKFSPPRGGRGSQSDSKTPVQAAFWQPPEATAKSDVWRYQDGAIFCGWCDDTPIGVKDDRHILIVAGARAGKSSTVLLPNLYLYGGAAVVLDPKGELATLTAEHRADTLGHDVHVLDPWGQADVRDDLRARFDPLAELRRGAASDLVDDAALMAEALIQDQGENNGHWTSAARDFVRAGLLWFAMGGVDRSMADLPRLVADCMAVADDTDPEDNPFAAMLDYEGGDNEPADVGDVIRNAAKGMMGTPFKERASILSTARNQLGFLESGNMRDDLRESTFNLSALKNTDKPATIYLCLPASRMGTHAKWLRLILNMTMATLERDKRKPALPVLLMLEEFAALGHMRALEQAAAYMAGFGVKLFTVLQDLTQLKRHYKEGWETFVGNSAIVVAFGNSDQTTLDYLSKRLGETFVYVRETAQHGSGATAAGAAPVREQFQKVPLLSPDEIAKSFGRRHYTALVIMADAPPIALERRHLEPADLFRLIEGNRHD